MVFKRASKLAPYQIWLILIIIILSATIFGMYWLSGDVSKPLFCSCKNGKYCDCSKCKHKKHHGKHKKHVHWKENFESGPTAGNWSDQIDVIYYINLDRREDRNKQFVQEMTKMGVPPSKIVRIPAVDKSKQKQGDWGCSLSHVNAIQAMVNSKYSNCAIFEDDFEFTIDNIETLNKMFDSIKGVDYDVIMFSCNEVDVRPTEYPHLKRVYNAQTASGYMVSSKFAPTLLENFQMGANLIGESYNKGKGDNIQGPYCVDQYWKKLQPESNWYVFTPKIGKQRSSVSDIQGGFVNMNV